MKLTLVIFLLSFSLFAKFSARVGDFEGASFLFLKNGKSKQLQYADKIPLNADIMIDDQAYVTLVDDQGNTYYLAGGSYVNFTEGQMEVKNGYIWTRAKSTYPKAMLTINSVINYSHGDFIITVDSSNSKTQVIVMNGQVNFSSNIEKDLLVPVQSGEFTFIDQNYESGLPRSPTRIGLNSYHKVKGLFSSISHLKSDRFEREFFGNKLNNPKREIASVKSSNITPSLRKDKLVSEAKITYIRTVESSRSIASVESSSESTGVHRSSPHQYYKGLKNLPSQPKLKNEVQINYIGFQFNKPHESIKENTVNQSTNRQPASIAPSKNSQNIVDDINSAFRKSFDQNVENYKRHPEEVNQLIDELKSFNNNYQKDF